MPPRFVLLCLLLAFCHSAVSNFTDTNSTKSDSFTQFLSCCPNNTQPAAVCLDARFNTSEHFALHSQFMHINRTELGLCPNQVHNIFNTSNQSSSNATLQFHNASNASNHSSSNATSPSSCTPKQQSLDCFNGTLMNDVCAPTNQSGYRWSCVDRPVLDSFNLSKCIEAFQQNNISDQDSDAGAEKSLSAFFSTSFSQVAGLEQSGSNALNISWISFLVASIALTICSRSRVCEHKAERRVMRVLIAVNIFAMIAYLVMSAGEGRVKIYRVQINQQSTTFSMALIPEPKQHQWYARHALWIITTPGLLYALWFMGGAMVEYFVLAVAFAEIMLVCGLLATLLADSPAARWLLLIYGVFFFCIIVYLLIRRFIAENSRVSHQKKRQERMRSAFTLAANYTVIVWLMYPIFWILADGLDQLNDNAAVIAFSILDMASKIGFSVIFFHSCKKSNDWLKTMFIFSDKKSTQPTTASEQQQQQQQQQRQAVTAPAPVAAGNASSTVIDAVVDIQSPTDYRRKHKSSRERSSTTGGMRNQAILSPVKTGLPAIASESADV